jgi:hypothetical protein
LPSSSLSGVCSLILFPLFATGVNNTSGTGGKIFDASVINTGGKFATGVVDTGGTLTCEFEMTLVLFSGAWGKVIHEKNLKQKIS